MSTHSQPSAKLVTRLLTSLPLGDYFSPAQLAAQVERPISWVLGAIHRGDIPARHVCGQWVISKDALNATFRARTDEATDANREANHVS